MSELTCDEVLDRTPALIAGDLSTEEEAEIARHAATCSECAAEVDLSRRLSDALNLIAARESVARHVAEQEPVLRRRLLATLPRAAAFDRIDSPLGPLFLVVTDAGLCRIAYRGTDADLEAWGEAHDLRLEHRPAELAPVAAELRQYFDGERLEFDIPVDLATVSPFARRVLGATARVPFGRLVTYRDIASRIGQPGATRAVGNALGQNPVPIVVPCHRVIRSGGHIGGYSGGLEIKWRLLEIEGSTLGVGGR